MIVELTVDNLAIIEHAQINLGPGFTVLTGETGAGKSLLIDAIELALGERADTELVRAGARSATVNVVIDLSNSPDALDRCRELGVALEDSTLYINREVFAEGRSQCRIGGRLTPVATLRQIGQFLVDLHGQHDHQSLLNQERHLEYLDEWIGRPAHDLRATVAARHAEVEDARRRLVALRSGMRDREQRLDLLRFQVSEIEAVSPVVGEMEELETQLSRLKYAERLATASFSALEAAADQENCAADLLGGAVKSLEDVLRYDAGLEAVLVPLRDALYQLEEGTHSLRQYAEGLEADPAVLDEVSTRIDALKRLRRKYGDSEDAVLKHLSEARSQLDLMEDAEASEESMQEALAGRQQILDVAAAELTSLRTQKAAEFSGLVQEQLRDLAMDRAVFEVDLRPQPADPTGADRVEFFFTANAGEPARPLGKIASGGEISRVMLAIKTALAGRAGVPTLIFDEADTGIGGRAAGTVARKLEELAIHYQVLVISHLPQVASQGSTHFRIEKVERDGRVVTEVRALAAQERVEEIARMLAGETLSESALANARDLLGDRVPRISLFD